MLFKMPFTDPNISEKIVFVRRTDNVGSSNLTKSSPEQKQTSKKYNFYFNETQ